MRRFIRAVVLVGCASGIVALAGCNTVEGIGRDLEAGGEKLQDAVR
ncbi:MAG TPA: entericidin A/B family lipoprotein [Phycisphaerales bacterium]|nr:entericidin A/B family lipoprotein [Phycisphaerales bacterium]HZW05743.1 entericidin A/B family lipoprotein [Phycisphaerales bacterium]